MISTLRGRLVEWLTSYPCPFHQMTKRCRVLWMSLASCILLTLKWWCSEHNVWVYLDILCCLQGFIWYIKCLFKEVTKSVLGLLSVNKLAFKAWGKVAYVHDLILFLAWPSARSLVLFDKCLRGWTGFCNSWIRLGVMVWTTTEGHKTPEVFWLVSFLHDKQSKTEKNPKGVCLRAVGS